jgi:dTMP kinase
MGAEKSGARRMTTKKTLFIVFEGLDGSGKSTCAKALAEYLDAELMTTPSDQVRAYRDALISDLGASQEAHQLFYLATVFSASKTVEQTLAKGRSVVLDRYFLSTQAYAKFRGSTLDLDALQQCLFPADATILIDLSFDERKARLEERKITAADQETLSTEANERLLHEHDIRASLDVIGRFIRIDGDRLNEEETLARVLEELGL